MSLVFVHDRINLRCWVKHVLDDEVAFLLEAFSIDPSADATATPYPFSVPMLRVLCSY